MFGNENQKEKKNFNRLHNNATIHDNLKSLIKNILIKLSTQCNTTFILL